MRPSLELSLKVGHTTVVLAFTPFSWSIKPVWLNFNDPDYDNYTDWSYRSHWLCFGFYANKRMDLISMLTKSNKCEKL